MRYFYLLICLFSAFSGAAQSYYKGVTTDKVTVNSTDQTVTAYLHPLNEQAALDPQKNYYWYSANQINRTQGGFSGRLLNGAYTVFYMNKNLKEQGEFKKGLQHGEWRSWYENGQLKEIVKWRSGHRAGKFEEFNEQGTMTKRGRYNAGRLQGNLTTYAGKDSTQVVKYKDGEPVVKTKKVARKGVLSNLRLKSRAQAVWGKVFKKKDKNANTAEKSKKKKVSKPREKKADVMSKP